MFALPGFVERCRRHSDRVLVDAPAVNMELFDPARAASPRGRRGGRAPAIGYVGAIQRNLDLVLLERLARERPDWTWVFVGPVHCRAEALELLPNVRMVGALGHDELPAAISAFDVCISPLLIDAYTSSMVPTKFGEYLAMGKPVVSTPIPFAVELERSSGGMVTTAEPDEARFLRALEGALELVDQASTAARCRAIAATRSWSQRIEQVSAELLACAGAAQGAAGASFAPARGGHGRR